MRGHHLLCMLTYIGKGYTRDFTDNFDAVIGRINRGAAIEIVAGADVICGALRKNNIMVCDHARVCRAARTMQRDQRALRDVGRVLRKPGLAVGDRLQLGRREITQLRHAFAQNAIRSGCSRCQWRGLCTQIAASGFEGVRLSS